MQIFSVLLSEDQLAQIESVEVINIAQQPIAELIAHSTDIRSAASFS